MSVWGSPWKGVLEPVSRPTWLANLSGAGGASTVIAAKYWRVVVNAVEDIYRIELSELHLKEAGTGNILTAGMTPTSNSTRAPGSYDVTQLTDGNPDTRFVSDLYELSGIWVEFNFGTVKEIGAVEMQIQAQQIRAPSDLSLEYSEDGTTWTEVARWADFNWTADYQIETRMVAA